jgi:glutathionyl-hydroquinone reductase
MQRWLQDLWSLQGVAAASNLDHCKRGYFGRTGNNIVPLGPQLD